MEAEIRENQKGTCMKNIDIFANEYLGKVFYFCLKKTGNEEEVHYQLFHFSEGVSE